MVGQSVLFTLFRPLLEQFGRPHGPLGWLATLLIPLGHRPFYGKSAAVLQLRPDDVLLDVACGSGEFLDEQAGQVAEVTGIDISDVQVRRARRKLRDRIVAGTARVVEGDAAALPLPEAECTAVNCVGSFLGFDDPARALSEMHRVLRPGGRAVVCLEEHGADGRVHTRDEQLWGFTFYTEQQIRDLFAQADFQDVTVTLDGGAMVVRGVRRQSWRNAPARPCRTARAPATSRARSRRCSPSPGTA